MPTSEEDIFKEAQELSGQDQLRVRQRWRKKRVRCVRKGCPKRIMGEWLVKELRHCKDEIDAPGTSTDDKRELQLGKIAQRTRAGMLIEVHLGCSSALE
jgi:hypothetical protein